MILLLFIVRKNFLYESISNLTNKLNSFNNNYFNIY